MRYFILFPTYLYPILSYLSKLHRYPWPYLPIYHFLSVFPKPKTHYSFIHSLLSPLTNPTRNLSVWRHCPKPKNTFVRPGHLIRQQLNIIRGEKNSSREHNFPFGKMPPRTQVPASAVRDPGPGTAVEGKGRSCFTFLLLRLCARLLERSAPWVIRIYQEAFGPEAVEWVRIFLAACVPKV